MAALRRRPDYTVTPKKSREDSALPLDEGKLPKHPRALVGFSNRVLPTAAEKHASYWRFFVRHPQGWWPAGISLF
jgi:hypothetical protein